MKWIDWVVLVIAIFVVIGIIYKITDGNIDPGTLGTAQKEVDITFEVYAEDMDMLKHIQVGDQLSEAKRNLDAYVTAISLRPNTSDQVLIDQNKTVYQSGTSGIADVTVRAKVEVKGDALKIGNQEYRVGKMVYFESLLYKLSSRVMGVFE